MRAVDLEEIRRIKERELNIADNEVANETTPFAHKKALGAYLAMRELEEEHAVEVVPVEAVREMYEDILEPLLDIVQFLQDEHSLREPVSKKNWAAAKALTSCSKIKVITFGLIPESEDYK